MATTNDTLVVLAAGQGSRLGTMTVPKWLLPVCGRSIAERQFSAFPGEVLGGFVERIVVAGFAAEVVEEFVKGLVIPFKLLFNERWREFNNWYSLLIALDNLAAACFDGNIVLLNSDLLFTAPVVAPFFAEHHQSRALGDLVGGDIELLVDSERKLTDEAMKISCQWGDDPRVDGIGKTGLECPVAEDIGMWRLAPPGWARLRGALQQFAQRPGCEQLWYQNALADLIAEDLAAGRPPLVSATRTGCSDWVEVDDQNDFQLAERLVLTGSWSSAWASTQNVVESLR